MRVQISSDAMHSQGERTWGFGSLKPEPPQCTCRHFLFKDRSPNSISLGYRQGPSLAM